MPLPSALAPLLLAAALSLPAPAWTSPEAKAAPETAAKPEAEAAPETAAKPEARAAPEAAAKPEARAAPEAAAKPEAEASPEAGSASPQLLGFQLLNLATLEVESLQKFKGKPTLMTFFQPDCGWCLRQARALNRLHQTCGADISLLAVGVHGSRRELKQELRRLRPRYAAYQASAALLASLGGAPPTPFSLVAGRDGRFLAWMQGYLPPEEVAEQFQGLPPACTPNRTPVRPS